MRLSRPCIDNSAARNRLDAGHLRIEIFEGYGNMEESFECCDEMMMRRTLRTHQRLSSQMMDQMRQFDNVAVNLKEFERMFQEEATLFV